MMASTISVILAGLGGLLTHYAIGKAGPSFVKAGLKGKDLCKKHKPVIPESMGMISGAIFLIVSTKVMI